MSSNCVRIEYKTEDGGEGHAFVFDSREALRDFILREVQEAVDESDELMALSYGGVTVLPGDVNGAVLGAAALLAEPRPRLVYLAEELEVAQEVE